MSAYSARQHVPLQEYQQNLHIIVQRMKSMSVPAIILITPPPVHDAARVKHNQNVSAGTILAEPQALVPGSVS